jgi:hypothetical protein
MGGVVRTIGKIAGIVGAVAAMGSGLGVLLGGTMMFAGLVSAGTIAIGAGIASLGASLLAGRPRAPEVPGSVTDRLTASIDPRAPRKIVFGITAMKADLA